MVTGSIRIPPFPQPTKMLLSQLWGTGYGADSHYLHVYLGQLRRKIEPGPASPHFIHTVPGAGHRFTEEQ